MNVFYKLLGKIEVIAFVTGFVVGTYMLVFYPAKYFLVWHALPSPPEPITKIFSVDHMGSILVDTVTNKKYECDLGNETVCWTEIDYEPIPFGTVLCFENCFDDNVRQIIKATGQYHNFGELSFTYALRDDGLIYVKHSGFLYLPGYMMGVFLGGICTVVVVLGKYLFLSIASLFLRD